MSDVYGMLPINKTAGVVTSQANCSDDINVSPRDLSYQAHKMIATKRKELSEKLGILTYAQKKNNMYRIKNRKGYVKNHPQKELLLEWWKLGKEAERIMNYLHSIKPPKG